MVRAPACFFLDPRQVGGDIGVDCFVRSVEFHYSSRWESLFGSLQQRARTAKNGSLPHGFDFHHFGFMLAHSVSPAAS